MDYTPSRGRGSSSFHLRFPFPACCKSRRRGDDVTRTLHASLQLCMGRVAALQPLFHRLLYHNWDEYLMQNDEEVLGSLPTGKRIGRLNQCRDVACYTQVLHLRIQALIDAASHHVQERQHVICEITTLFENLVPISEGQSLFFCRSSHPFFQSFHGCWGLFGIKPLL